MTPEQRNLLIAVVAIMLIAGGIFYYSRSRPLPGLPLDNGEEKGGGTIDDSGEEISTPPPQAETPQEGNESGEKITPDSATAKSAPNLKEKFDTAMANASFAFLRGDYALALKHYNDALAIKKSDVVYSGMFHVYTAQKDWLKAGEAVDGALALNSKYTEYWKWKLTLLDERTSATYTELNQIYQDGLVKSDPRTKINLVTHFANVAESNGERAEAIALWEYAKELKPEKASIYQDEIDRVRGY